MYDLNVGIDTLTGQVPGHRGSIASAQSTHQLGIDVLTAVNWGTGTLAVR